MADFLTQLHAAGVACKLTAEGKINATGPLTDTLRQLIRANRAALVEELLAVAFIVGEIDIMRGGSDPGWLAWSPACRAAWARSMRSTAEESGIWKLLPDDARRWLADQAMMDGPPVTVAASSRPCGCQGRTHVGWPENALALGCRTYRSGLITTSTTVPGRGVQIFGGRQSQPRAYSNAYCNGF